MVDVLVSKTAEHASCVGVGLYHRPDASISGVMHRICS